MTYIAWVSGRMPAPCKSRIISARRSYELQPRHADRLGLRTVEGVLPHARTDTDRRRAATVRPLHLPGGRRNAIHRGEGSGLAVAGWRRGIVLSVRSRGRRR